MHDCFALACDDVEVSVILFYDVLWADVAIDLFELIIVLQYFSPAGVLVSVVDWIVSYPESVVSYPLEFLLF